MKSPYQQELVSGTSTQAREDALMMQSLIVILVSFEAFI
jgi:hypothetical protein